MKEREPDLMIVYNNRKCFFAETSDWHYENGNLCFVSRPVGNKPSLPIKVVASFYRYDLDRPLPWETIENGKS